MYIMGNVYKITVSPPKIHFCLQTAVAGFPRPHPSHSRSRHQELNPPSLKRPEGKMYILPCGFSGEMLKSETSEKTIPYILTQQFRQGASLPFETRIRVLYKN